MTIPVDLPPNPIQIVAPAMNSRVAERVQKLLECGKNTKDAQKLMVFDATKKSSENRFFVIDVRDRANPKLVLESPVAHGSGSDPKSKGLIEKFSNAFNSHATSLGLYKIAERYTGKHPGASWRLDGLTKGFNDNARGRAVVIHSSSYVGNGRTGRSQGCPALPRQTVDRIAELKLTNAFLLIDDGKDDLNKALSLSCKG